jgi:two-component system, sensor histidine kinase and response regulator
LLAKRRMGSTPPPGNPLPATHGSAMSGAPTASAGVRPEARGRILLAEDNVMNQQMLATIVRRLGYEVDVAGHGGEALQAMATGAYDVVILDCHMPVMDGFEAAAEIRRRETGARRLPIIALTADASAGVEERCTAAGMDIYLTKPVGRTHLGALLERFCIRRAD